MRDSGRVGGIEDGGGRRLGQLGADRLEDFGDLKHLVTRLPHALLDGHNVAGGARFVCAGVQRTAVLCVRGDLGESRNKNEGEEHEGDEGDELFSDKEK